jgi:TctA family transporter
MDQATWRQVGPVLLSILIIIVVAIVRSYSRTLAAITATMPVVVPLSLWIVWSSSRGDRATVQQYTGVLLSGIGGTVAFIVTLWLAARAGWRLGPMLGVGYLVWAVVVAGLMLAWRMLGG